MLKILMTEPIEFKSWIRNTETNGLKQPRQNCTRDGWYFKDISCIYFGLLGAKWVLTVNVLYPGKLGNLNGEAGYSRILKQVPCFPASSLMNSSSVVQFSLIHIYSTVV